MMRRGIVRVATGIALCTLLAALAFAGRASAGEVIKIGTLAPKSSPWGKVFETWAKAVKEKSGGSLELQIFYNGAQGDEGAMVGKVKSGQLDGAAVTAVGLGKVYKPILALQTLGLFTTWAKLDKARDGMKGEFEKGAKDAGFTIVGWADVGVVRLMSKGVRINVPDDLKGTKPFSWRDDPMPTIVYQLIGGVTPVPLNIPEVLPNLNTGAINILMAPALAAEQLQWSSKLDTIMADTLSISIGGLVISSKRLDALSEEQRNIVLDTGKVAAAALTKRIRAEDDAAFARLKGKMAVVTWSADDKAKWDALFKQLRARLGQGTFSADLMTKLEGYAK